MTIAAPIAGYSFDAQSGVDEVGTNDLIFDNEEYGDGYHGDYAAAAVTGGNEAYSEGDPLTDGAITVAGWLYLKDDTAGNQFGVYGDYDGQVGFDGDVAFASFGQVTTLSSATLTVPGWNFLASGVDADGYAFLAANGETIVTGDAVTPDTYIGTWFTLLLDQSSDPGARLDDFAVWDTALSQSEIDWLYNSGAGRSIADIVAASSGITIEPNLIASGATVYQPAVSQIVKPELVASAATIYEPSVQPGGITVAPNAISSAATVYQPAVQPGSISVAPNLIASAAEVNAPAVTMGALTVQAVRIESATTVYDPALTFGSVTVAPERVESAATVYQPFVNVVQTVEPEQVESAAVVYQPAVQPGSITVAPELVAATATVYQPAVHPGSITVSPNAIASVVAVYQPAVGVVQTIEVERVESAAQVYAPAVQVGALTIYPAAVASGVQVYQPLVLPGAITIEPGRIESTAQVFPVWFIMLSVVTGAARIHTVGQDGRSFTPVDDRVVSVGAEARSVAVTGE